MIHKIAVIMTANLKIILFFKQSARLKKQDKG